MVLGVARELIVLDREDAARGMRLAPSASSALPSAALRPFRSADLGVHAPPCAPGGPPAAPPPAGGRFCLRARRRARRLGRRLEAVHVRERDEDVEARVGRALDHAAVAHEVRVVVGRRRARAA